jgi:3-oxoadipyl-CoA thiolase
MTEDAYLCDFIRTPIGRYGGGLARVRTDDLAAIPLRELLLRHPDLGGSIDEVILGCANQAGEDNRNVARMALLLAGFPDSVPGVTLNRLCASGLEAIGYAARAIRSGEISIAMAGGVESMSRAPLVMPKAEAAFQRTTEIHDTTLGWRFINPKLRTLVGVDSMPETGENVAGDFNISREDQDAFAYRSQKRTKNAKANGILARSIVGVDAPGEKSGTVRIVEDEHPRFDTTLQALGALKPIVRPGGTVTAGNASGLNDGACAMIIASTSAVKAFGLSPKAKIVGMASAGVTPRVMGIGPVPAVKKLLARLGWELPSVDVIELNEAFASQALACLREWGLPDDAEHVNPNGGAIALGHPLGMSGARIAGAAAEELVRRNARRAIVTMCVGVGQGVALALERV